MIVLVQISTSKSAIAAPGSPTNVLNNQVVSYINATCQADPLNCAGSYHSESSWALLYVPEGVGTAQVTINNVGNGVTAGGLSNFGMSPLTDAPGYACGNPVTNVWYAGSGTTLSLSNNPPSAGNIRQITNFGTGVVYNVYCVYVYTDGSVPYPNRENVRYSLSTTASALLGVFPGPQQNLGTGYFGGNLVPNNPWSQAVAFSPPCTDAGANTTGNTAMTLYDLDTYQAQSSNMKLYVAKTLKPGIASAPDGGVAGVFYNVGLSGPLTQEGNNVYDINNVATGVAVSINISGESYQSLYSYSLVIYGIGSANKIRIRLPYDQVNASITCQSTTPPPTCTLSNSVLAAGVRLTWTTTNNATSITINNGVGSVTPVASGNTTIGLSPGTTYSATATGPGGTSQPCTTTVAAGPTPVPNIVCPSYPPYASFPNPNVIVSLPNAGKPADSYSAAYNGSTISDTGWIESTLSRYRTQVQQAYVTRTYYVYITSQPQPKTEVDSVISTIAGGSPVSINVTFDDIWDSDGTAELDYTSTASNYPYDPADPVVSYRVRYEVRQVQQIVYRSRTLTQTRTSATAPWGPSSGFFPAWPISGTDVGGTDVSLGFNWTGTLTANATQLPPCYPRQYSAQPTPASASFSLGTRESPEQSSFSFTIPTTLSYSNGGALRTPTTVNGISYTVDWAAEGYSNPSYSGSFSRTANITNTSLANNAIGSAGNLSEVVSVSVPANILAGDRICWTVTINQPTGTVKAGGTIWNPAGPVRTSVKTCTPLAIDQPYSRFYGADIFAGGGFTDIDDTCTATNPNAGLVGAMKGINVATYSGTGTQLGAFALGQITDVQALSQSGRAPMGLSFANANTTATITPGSRLFGGGFGTMSCANNYFADIPSTVTWDTSTGNINIGDPALATGRHYYQGDMNIFGQLPNDVDATGEGRRLVIYVDGNVSVQVNNDGSATGKFGYVNNVNWPSVNAIPSLYIIARGNILIDDGVNELDGVFIAQQSPTAPATTGFIDTCSNNGTSLMPTTSNTAAISVGCRSQLRVNGAFIAKRVNLLRTLGSLRESVPQEGPITTRSAETFIYNPTLWFTSGGNLPANKKIQIDSYTSLPPSL